MLYGFFFVYLKIRFFFLFMLKTNVLALKLFWFKSLQQFSNKILKTLNFLLFFL